MPRRADTYFIVMTHNHTLDLVLAERILRRGDFAFFGMIGSHTKRKQFEHRLAARGIDPVRIARMNARSASTASSTRRRKSSPLQRQPNCCRRSKRHAHASSQQMACSITLSPIFKP